MGGGNKIKFTDEIVSFAMSSVYKWTEITILLFRYEINFPKITYSRPGTVSPSFPPFKLGLRLIQASDNKIYIISIPSISAVNCCLPFRALSSLVVYFSFVADLRLHQVCHSPLVRADDSQPCIIFMDEGKVVGSVDF